MSVVELLVTTLCPARMNSVSNSVVAIDGERRDESLARDVGDREFAGGHARVAGEPNYWVRVSDVRLKGIQALRICCRILGVEADVEPSVDLGPGHLTNGVGVEPHQGPRIGHTQRADASRPSAAGNRRGVGGHRAGQDGDQRQSKQ